VVAIVKSHVRDRPLCQGISVRLPGHLPSLRKRQEGCFVTGILAEANAREMMSLRAWCLVIRLGAILHTKAWRPHVFTCDPHRQVCAAQRPRPSRKTTATRTASSSSWRPHEAIGSANLLLFFTRGIKDPEGFGLKLEENCRNDHYSGQSSNTKESCSSTPLNR